MNYLDCQVLNSWITHKANISIIHSINSKLVFKGFLALYYLQDVAALFLLYDDVIDVLPPPRSNRRTVIHHTKGQVTPKHLLKWQHWQRTAKTKRITTFNVHSSCITCVIALIPAKKLYGLNAKTLLKVLKCLRLLCLLTLCPKCQRSFTGHDLFCLNTDCSQEQCVSHASRQ